MTTSALNEAALRRTLSRARSRGIVADNPGLNDEKRVSRLTSCSLQSGTDRLVAHTKHFAAAMLSVADEPFFEKSRVVDNTPGASSLA
jgi:hypothetical protein